MGIDYVVLPYAPGADTRLYLLPSLNLGNQKNWHIYEYSGPNFSPKRYAEELEEFIQLNCHEDTLVMVAHSTACRMSLEFLSKSMCYPDALAWISPILDPKKSHDLLYKGINEGATHEEKLSHWCKTLMNKDSYDMAQGLVVHGAVDPVVFREYEEYIWNQDPIKISAAVSRLPLFALSGGLDPLNSFESLSQSLKSFYNKTITELTDIGHCPFIESPNVLGFLLEDFANDVSRQLTFAKKPAMLETS